jgi:hypothetical protein
MTSGPAAGARGSESPELRGSAGRAVSSSTCSSDIVISYSPFGNRVSAPGAA